MEEQRCRRCNRVIKSRKAIQIGLGMTCLRKMIGRRVRSRAAKSEPEDKNQMRLFEEVE